MSDGLLYFSRNLQQAGGQLKQAASVVAQARYKADYNQQYNNAVVGLDEFYNGFYKDHVLNYDPVQAQNADPSEYWSKLSTRFQEAAQQTWKDMLPKLRNNDARTAAEQYFRKFVSDQGLKISQAASQQDVKLKQIDYNVQLDTAKRNHDLKMIDQLTEGASPIVVAPAQAEQDRLNAYTQVAYDEFRQQAMSLGLENGILWLKDPENKLEFSDGRGHTLALSDQQRATMVDGLQGELINQLRMQQEQAKAADEKAWAAANKAFDLGQLTSPLQLYGKDYVGLSTDHLVQMRNMINARNKAILAGEKDPNTISSPAVKAVVIDALHNDNLSEDSKTQFILDNMGADADGKPRLSINDARSLMNDVSKYSKKSPTQIALNTAYDKFSTAAKPDKKGNSLITANEAALDKIALDNWAKENPNAKPEEILQAADNMLAHRTSEKVTAAIEVVPERYDWQPDIKQPFLRGVVQTAAGIFGGQAAQSMRATRDARTTSDTEQALLNLWAGKYSGPLVSDPAYAQFFQSVLGRAVDSYKRTFNKSPSVTPQVDPKSGIPLLYDGKDTWSVQMIDGKETWVKYVQNPTTGLYFWEPTVEAK